MLLAGEDDLDLAPVRFDPRAFLPTSFTLTVRLTVSAPERAIHVSVYVPGRRIFFGSVSFTTFAPGLRCRAFQV